MVVPKKMLETSLNRTNILAAFPNVHNKNPSMVIYSRAASSVADQRKPSTVKQWRGRKPGAILGSAKFTCRCCCLAASGSPTSLNFVSARLCVRRSSPGTCDSGVIISLITRTNGPPALGQRRRIIPELDPRGSATCETPTFSTIFALLWLALNEYAIVFLSLYAALSPAPLFRCRRAEGQTFFSFLNQRCPFYATVALSFLVSLIFGERLPIANI
jgi:hypothetical protein